VKFVDGDGGHDIYDKSSARERTFEEIERNMQLREALSILMKRGRCHQKWMRITQKPRIEERTPVRG